MTLMTNHKGLLRSDIMVEILDEIIDKGRINLTNLSLIKYLADTIEHVHRFHFNIYLKNSSKYNDLLTKCYQIRQLDINLTNRQNLTERLYNSIELLIYDIYVEVYKVSNLSYYKVLNYALSFLEINEKLSLAMWNFLTEFEKDITYKRLNNSSYDSLYNLIQTKLEQGTPSLAIYHPYAVDRVSDIIEILRLRMIIERGV